MRCLKAALLGALLFTCSSAALAQVAFDGRSGEPVRLVLRSELGSLFELQEVGARLNGEPIELGEVIPGAKRVVFEGTLPEGRHVLVLDVVYTGDGELFTSYLEEFEVHVLRELAVDVTEGGTLVEVVVDETGGFFTELAEQPALSYRVRPLSDVDAP